MCSSSIAFPRRPLRKHPSNQSGAASDGVHWGAGGTCPIAATFAPAGAQTRSTISTALAPSTVLIESARAEDQLANGSEFCANAPAHVSRKSSSAAIADALVVRRGRSTPGRRLTQSRARHVVLRRRHRDSRLRSRSPLPRGIRPMLRAAAQVRRRPAPGSEVIPARSRDPVRAASTEGVTAVPPQQPPPDAARVRIVLRSATSCASRKARDSQRQAGSDRTTCPSTSRPCPRPRAGSPGAVRPVRRYRARRLTSPGSTVSSPRRRGSASTSCDTARVIAEIARDSRRCRSSCPKRDGAPPRTFQPSCPASAPSPF